MQRFSLISFVLALFVMGIISGSGQTGARTVLATATWGMIHQESR